MSDPVTISLDPTTIILLALFVVQWVRTERRQVSRQDLEGIVARVVRAETEPAQQLVRGLEALSTKASE